MEFSLSITFSSGKVIKVPMSLKNLHGKENFLA